MRGAHGGQANGDLFIAKASAGKPETWRGLPARPSGSASFRLLSNCS